jgi:hypothetical protein
VEPNWKPLEDKLGAGRCVGFMFMGRVNGVNLYKHGITRTYLNLDDEGNCYLRGETGCYRPGNWQIELAKVEKSLERMGMSLNSAYDGGFRARKQRALEAVGIGLVTLEIEPQDHSIH